MKNKIWPVVVWLCVWQAAAMAADLPIFFVTPLTVFKTFITLAGTAEFWSSAVYTLVHIAAGFLLALFVSVLLAGLSARFVHVEEFLTPPMLVIKSVPVVSFIILALICFSSKHLAILISFLMVLPILYANILTGIRQTDRKLLEMADVFRVNGMRRARYIYLPQVFPYFRAACASALGIAWKSGTAAEVIGIPAGSIGERLQEAKTYLMTADLFAWTVLIVLLSLGMEKISLWAIDELYHLSQRVREKKNRGAVTVARDDMDGGAGALHFPAISKTYGGHVVLRDMSVSVPAGRTTVIMGPSGVGKTTLLRILMGLESADGVKSADGMKIPAHRFSAVFQEDRLLEHMSVEENIRLVNPNVPEESIAEAVRATGLADEIHLGQPIRAYSGGMKRRAALIRALLAPHDILVLDEPYKGLDEETKARVIDYAKRQTCGRTVILVTHDEDERRQFGEENLIRM